MPGRLRVPRETRTSSLHPWSRPVAGRDRRSQSTVATRAPRARSRQSAQGRRFDNGLLPRRQRRAGHLCASGWNRRLLDLRGVSAGVRRRCRFGLPGKRSRAGGFEAVTVGYRRVVQSDHPRRHHLTERVRRFHDDDRRAAGPGLDRTRLRKYLVWVDGSNTYCGIGQYYGDSSPDQGNHNNGAVAMFARVDKPCWGLLAGPGTHSVEAHELTHTLGAVNSRAPNATPNGHCTDDYDTMCYDDGPVSS